MVFFGIAFSAVVPLSIPLTAAGMVLNYWLTKYNVLRYVNCTEDSNAWTRFVYPVISRLRPYT